MGTETGNRAVQFEVLTLFPSMISSVIQESILKRAQDKGLVSIRVHSLREYSGRKHRVIDDSPYGGGTGMVLRPEPIFAAVEAIQAGGDPLRTLLPSPRGRVFDQKWAEELSRERRTIVLVCGHYEGVDERVRIGLSAEEVSLGDFVLTGGELAALTVLDATIRLIPGVLGQPGSLLEESFVHSLLEYPHYTRPDTFRGMQVPEILRSGHHEKISRWRRQQALITTLNNRPDLFEKAVQSRQVTREDQALLDEVMDS